MKKLLKYTHPAAMKYGTADTYELEELKKELDFEMIKVLFTPINFKWEDLNKVVDKIITKDIVED
jgi:hypothetical protein